MPLLDTTTRAPGVYIQEITPTGPIAGTGTSTPAFIGTAAKVDAPGEPTAVTNWTMFAEKFGGFDKTKTLPLAVRGFFENGGTSAYIVAEKQKVDASTVDAALEKLRAYADVSMVCLPTVVDTELQKKLIDHCEKMNNRVAILDGAQDKDPLKPDGALQKQRDALLSKTGHAALYWPWIMVPNPDAGPEKPNEPKVIPTAPAGHIAGVIARSDSQRGVHKAPANEPVKGASDLEFTLDNTLQGMLNNRNINALRTFPRQSQPIVWGARTLTDGVPWRYLNVRRLISFIEDSIVTGTNWAVFEPNGLDLWKRLELSISEFLTRVWQSGALFGATADQAFYVKIDDELNPESTRAQGQLWGEIGVAPVRPAEFVIFQVGIWDGGAQVSET